MRETKLQDSCLKWVHSTYHGQLLAVNNHGSGWSNKGFPDISIWGNEKGIVVEVKRDDSSYGLQDAQAVWRKRFQRAHTPHYVIENIDEFIDAVTKEFGEYEDQR